MKERHRLKFLLAFNIPKCRSITCLFHSRVGSSSLEGHAPAWSSAKNVDALYNYPLQAANQAMSFMKDCIFPPTWHRPTFYAAYKVSTKEHFGVSLQIYFSQPSLVNSNALGFDAGGSPDIGSNVLAQLTYRQGMFFWIARYLGGQACFKWQFRIANCDTDLEGMRWDEMHPSQQKVEVCLQS